MDLNKLTVGDRVVAIAAIVFLVAMFLPWYGAPGATQLTGSHNGFNYFLFGWIPLLLAIAMVVQIALTRFSAVEMPKVGTLTWGQIHLILGAVAAVLVLLRLLITDTISGFGFSVDLDREFGLFIALLAAIGLAAGGLLKMRDPADAGAAPPPPA